MDAIIQKPADHSPYCRCVACGGPVPADQAIAYGPGEPRFVITVREAGGSWTWGLYDRRTMGPLDDRLWSATPIGARRILDYLVQSLGPEHFEIEDTLEKERAMSTAVAKVDKQNKALSEGLWKYRNRIAKVAPRHVTPERLMSVALAAAQRKPELYQCSIESIIGCIVQASCFGFELDEKLGFAYLIPRKNKHTGHKECQLQFGYPGKMELVRRSGCVHSITARAVYAQEKFSPPGGTDARIKHIPLPPSKRGELVAVYAVAEMKDGPPKAEWMWKEEVEQIRKNADSGNSDAWKKSYDEMAKKTVINRICKTLPKDTQYHHLEGLQHLAKASELDDAFDAGEPQQLPQLPEDDPNTLTLEPPVTVGTQIAEEFVDRQRELFRKYMGALQACEALSAIAELAAAATKDSELSKETLAEIQDECEVRRNEIRGSRGERSNPSEAATDAATSTAICESSGEAKEMERQAFLDETRQAIEQAKSESTLELIKAAANKAAIEGRIVAADVQLVAGWVAEKRGGKKGSKK